MVNPSRRFGLVARISNPPVCLVRNQMVKRTPAGLANRHLEPITEGE